jgi:hypothetical protein
LVDAEFSGSVALGAVGNETWRFRASGVDNGGRERLGIEGDTLSGIDSGEACSEDSLAGGREVANKGDTTEMAGSSSWASMSNGILLSAIIFA